MTSVGGVSISQTSSSISLICVVSSVVSSCEPLPVNRDQRLVSLSKASVAPLAGVISSTQLDCIGCSSVKSGVTSAVGSTSDATVGISGCWGVVTSVTGATSDATAGTFSESDSVYSPSFVVLSAASILVSLSDVADQRSAPATAEAAAPPARAALSPEVMLVTDDVSPSATFDAALVTPCAKFDVVGVVFSTEPDCVCA